MNNKIRQIQSLVVSCYLFTKVIIYVVTVQEAIFDLSIGEVKLGN